MIQVQATAVKLKRHEIMQQSELVYTRNWAGLHAQGHFTCFFCEGNILLRLDVATSTDDLHQGASLVYIQVSKSA